MFCNSNVKSKMDVFEAALNKAANKNGCELYFNPQKQKIVVKSKLGSFQNNYISHQCEHLDSNNSEDVKKVIAIFRSIMSEEIENHRGNVLIDEFNFTIGNLCKWGHIKCYYYLTSRLIFQKHGNNEEAALHKEINEALNHCETQLNFRTSYQYDSEFYFLVDAINNFACSFVLFKNLSSSQARCFPIPSDTLNTINMLESLDKEFNQNWSPFLYRLKSCLGSYSKIMECRRKLNFYDNSHFSPAHISTKLSQLIGKVHQFLANQLMALDIADFDIRASTTLPRVISEMISEYVGDFRFIEKLSPVSQEICAAPFQRQTKIRGFYDNNPQCIKKAYYNQAKLIIDLAIKYQIFHPAANDTNLDSKPFAESIMDPYFIIKIYEEFLR